MVIVELNWTGQRLINHQLASPVNPGTVMVVLPAKMQLATKTSQTSSPAFSYSATLLQPTHKSWQAMAYSKQEPQLGQSAHHVGVGWEGELYTAHQVVHVNRNVHKHIQAWHGGHVQGHKTAVRRKKTRKSQFVVVAYSACMVRAVRGA